MSRSPLDYEPRKIVESWRKFFVNEWRYFTAGFSREQTISSLKTLAWVVPLTLLIWIYAEREQVARTKNVSVPIDPVVDSSRLVTLIRPPPTDKNVILELEGPKAKLTEVLLRLSGGNYPRGLQVEIPTTFGADREHQIPALALIQNQKIFRDNGITVVDCQPSRLEVKIDTAVELPAQIQAPPDANVEGAPIFTPTKVTIRGPRGALDRARGSDGRLTVTADLSEVTMREPGHYDVHDVSIKLPQALSDQNITIIPAKVSASVTVRESDAMWPDPSMPIQLQLPYPGDLTRKYDVRINPLYLRNVEIIGPKNLINDMQTPGFAPLPNAVLKITDKDTHVVGKQQKIVTYDLPTGARVSDSFKNKMVEFEIVERSAADRAGGD